MLNILWVEDEYSEQKQTQWFKDRIVTIKNSFDSAVEVIKSDLFDYDIVVLDINLENSEHSPKAISHANQFSKGDVRAFLERSGMNLYFMLLENGFPKEHVVFLTANSNEQYTHINDLKQAFDNGDDGNFNKIFLSITRSFSDEDKRHAYQFIDKPDGYDENNFYELCNYLESHFKSVNEGQRKNTYEVLLDTAIDCRIEVPQAFNKNTNQLDEYLKIQESNQYLVLRRGIIDGCKHVESYESSDVFFDKYLLENELVQIEDVMNYFGILKNFFPVREPSNKKALYKIFIRTLSHEWEAAKSIKISLSKIKKDSQLAWIMRNTRHWITHNTNLFNDTDETLVAYLFIINIRVMFDSDAVMRDYESNLLKLFENESLDEDDFIRKKIPVSEVYIALRKLVKNNLDEIKDDYYFHTLANNIQESKSKIRHDHKLFIKLLYQMFWLLLSNPLSKTKDSENLSDIEFFNFKYQSEPYIQEIARHIYHRSFPEA